MSTAAFTFDNNPKLDLYELQTLSRGTILDPQWDNQRMTSTTKREKKSSLTLKERLFGQKKGRKDSNTPTKYDVVRNIDIVDSTKLQKDLKKDDTPVRASYTHGHRLEPHSKTSWCDTCEDLIWGLNIHAVRCIYCKYTCHSKCVSDVYLDCPKTPAAQKSLEDVTKETLEVLESIEDTKNRMENNNLPSFVTSISELRKLIEKYNSQSNSIMSLHNNYTFDGFIRVQLNLNRPVNISTDVSNLTLKKAVARNKAGRVRQRRPVTEIFPADNCGSISSSSYDSGVSSSHSNDSGVSSPPSSPPLSPPPLSPVETAVLSSMYSRRKANRKLSFYMPKGTYKPLHVTSTTTVKEVIEALLSKYNVTDNPKKYALFEKRKEKREDNEIEVIYHRLSDEQRPLVLLLSWGANNTSLSFALKEDERENIEWMNFEIPELDNFLKILQMEEDQLHAQIVQKYEQYRYALGNVIDEKNMTMKLAS